MNCKEILAQTTNTRDRNHIIQAIFDCNDLATPQLLCKLEKVRTDLLGCSRRVRNLEIFLETDPNNKVIRSRSRQAVRKYENKCRVQKLLLSELTDRSESVSHVQQWQR